MPPMPPVTRTGGIPGGKPPWDTCGQKKGQTGVKGWDAVAADLAGRFDLHRRLAAPGVSDPTLANVVQGSFEFAVLLSLSFVAVAALGRGDEAALRAALAGTPAQVAFVGSRRKFATLSARLAAAGVDPLRLAAVAAPAGLDIHAITPEEIALSILAQVVGWRRTGNRHPPAA